MYKKIIIIKSCNCLILAALLTALIVPIGCFREAVSERPPIPNIIWPKPPEVPRISFVNSISKPSDMKISEGIWEKFLKFFIGRSDAAITSPYGLKVDSDGRLYVVDSFLKSVHVYDFKENKYWLFPEEDATFVSPIDLAVDNKRKYIYVTDSKEAVIKVFKKEGFEFVKDIKNKTMGRPTGIAINEQTDELLVVDTINSTVLRFDLSSHNLKGIIGGSGERDGLFHSPSNIFVTKDGYIIVSDSLNFRVQIFTSEAVFIRAFGEAGQSPGYFSRPKGVAADSDGNIYVVDALFDNIQIFDKEGRLLMAFGGPGHNYGEFWLPSGIFIDSNDNIYVSDTYNKRVQIFQYIKGGGY